MYYFFFFNWLYQSTLQTSDVSSLYCWGDWGMGRLSDWPMLTEWVMDNSGNWRSSLFIILGIAWKCQSKLHFLSRCFCPVLLGLVSKGEKVVQVPQLVQSLVSWQRLPTSWQVTAKNMTGGTFYDIGPG